MNAREWRMFLEEVRHTRLGLLADLSGVEDVHDLLMAFQGSADLSPRRSKQEVDGLLRYFEERIQRAA